VRWFKEGRPLSGPEANAFEISHHNGRVRLTAPFAKASDSGRYTCMANNASGEASSTAELIVKGLS